MSGHLGRIARAALQITSVALSGYNWILLGRLACGTRACFVNFT